VVRKIDITNGSRYLGKQKVHMLNPQIAFHISSIKHRAISYEKNINRFIQYTPLEAIQWINFNRD